MNEYFDRISVLFDRETNMGGYSINEIWDCSLVFFPDLLGTNYQCLFNQTDLIHIFVDTEDSSIIPNNGEHVVIWTTPPLKIRDAGLPPDNNATEWASGIQELTTNEDFIDDIEFDFPSSSLKINTICDNLFIDGREIIGQNWRKWKHVEWTIDETIWNNCQSSINNNLVNINNTYNITLEIPSYCMNNDSNIYTSYNREFMFRLQVENWMEEIASTNISVYREDGIFATIVIDEEYGNSLDVSSL